jgi:alcohol dehydrogenase, propanol-preferring
MSMTGNTSGNSTSQRAVVVINAGPEARIEIQDVSIPQLKDDEVLVKLTHSGVCHSDVSFTYGDWMDLGFTFEGSQTPGHEGIGTVVAVGSYVSALKLGDRVGIKWIRRVCGVCHYCEAGKENWCESQTHSGRTTSGSFQQYVTAPANYVPIIPPEISGEHAGPLLCAGSTMYSALKTLNVTPGDWVVIVSLVFHFTTQAIKTQSQTGAGGGLGHLGIQYAKIMGFRVLAIDSGDREAFCMSQGAEIFLDFLTEPQLTSRVRDITGFGAVAVIVTASSRRSYEQAAKMLGHGGTLVCVSLPTEAFNIPLQPLDFLNKGCSVIGIGAGRLDQVQEALDFSAKHDIRPVVTVFPLDQAEDVFKMIHKQKIIGRAVLDLS